MKKLTLTIAIVLGLTMTTFAQGGLFRRGDDAGNSPDAGYALSNGTKAGGDSFGPAMPFHNNEGGDQPAPLGSGIVALMGLGAAYLVAKKRREE